jgi:hypothetical protein
MLQRNMRLTRTRKRNFAISCSYSDDRDSFMRLVNQDDN